MLEICNKMDIQMANVTGKFALGYLKLGILKTTKEAYAVFDVINICL